MGYLNRLILVNSAGYPLADVRLDGHCDIAGGQGVGKTTLMNAILYPFVVEDRFIDIDRLEKQRFSQYYFPSERNSFVIYEVVNNLGEPYCILIHRSGNSLYYHFISSPFDYEWLYEGEEQVKDWFEIRAKLDLKGINYKTVETREKFNNIFLGKGDHYQEQYSIVKGNNDKDAIRPLLSAIFRNLPFSQDTLKNALVAAVMSSNMINKEGIDLSSHRRNLEGFAERYSDIQKMTVLDKNGKTAIGPLSEVLFDAVDKYYTNRERLQKVPGRLMYAYNSTKERFGALEKSIDANKEALTKCKEDWEKLEKSLQDEIDAAGKEWGGVNKELEIIKEIEDKYKEKDVNIDDLVVYIKEKADHVKELASLKQQRDTLTSDSRDIQKEKEAALSKNTLYYQNLEAKERTEYAKKLDTLQELKNAAISAAEKSNTEVEKKYKALLSDNWKEAELSLVDGLIELSAKLATAETIEDVRAILKDSPVDYAAKLDSILTTRNGDATAIDAIKASINEERNRLETELNRKVQLESNKAKELAAISAKKNSTIDSANKEKDAVDKAHKEENKRIYDECLAKAKEINETFDTKIHGNNEQIKEALAELNGLIEGEEFVLKAIEEFPSAAEDKSRYLDKKPGLLKERSELNTTINALKQQKKEKKAAYDEQKSSLDAKIATETAEKNTLNNGIQEADKFLGARSDVKAACESATLIENEDLLPDIINDFSNINSTISELKEKVSKYTQRLYEPGMLSRLDTFQLGIGPNDSLSGFEDFLSVAEKLRTRLQNSAEAMGMDNFIRIYATKWFTEIRDINTAMSPIEKMLMQIGKLCSQATSFVKKHNKTDCIDSFSMKIDEEDTPDIVKLMRTISEFFNKNNTVLGYDNLFASDDGSINKQAVDYLSQFAEILQRDSDVKLISLASMFNIRMDLVEKGHAIKNLLSFNNPGSRGTAIVLKAMLNMTLLHIVLEKGQAPNTRLICAIDEMNTIEASNLDALTDFATAAGLYIIGSGQHHTKSALDYSYNVWDERDEDGIVHKFVSMDAMESTANEI